jgi:polyisoprenoid-binding protein YceI
VLKGEPIAFRSDSIEAADRGRRLRVRGDLEIGRQRHPVGFELSIGPEDKLTGGATIKQTDWGIEPYSGLFGALKVADEVEVVVEADAPSA